MDNIDKREKRAERKLSSRYSGVGKSDMRRDDDSQEDYSSSPVWCDCFPSRFRDQCDKCRCSGVDVGSKEGDKTGTFTIENGKITGVKYD